MAAPATTDAKGSLAEDGVVAGAGTADAAEVIADPGATAHSDATATARSDASEPDVAAPRL